ncbi:MAG: hypothetical protein R3F49_00840 [Planctomycetota bacterium]
MRLAVALGLAAGFAAGCSDTGPRAIENTRIADRSDPPVIPGVTLAQRYMWEPSQEEARRAQLAPPGAEEAPEFVYVLPETWEAVPATRFRMVNTRVMAAPSAECYLTFLPGDGGGDVPNVNRWRGEMGLTPVDAAAVAALPRTRLLGQPALLVDLEGSFTGMSGQTIAEARLLGVLLTRHDMPGALFVKFVGPTAVIADNVAEFEAFVASIDFGVPAAAQGGAGAGAGSGAAEDPGTGAKLRWQVPATWAQEPGARAMREVTLTKGECELYISVLSGGGGGVLANVNRWLGQFGAPKLDVAALAGLERAPCLGSEALLVTAEGSFGGMGGGAPKAGMGLLGAVLEQPARLITVKLVGPASEVAAERGAFLSFLGSLDDQL